MFKNKYKFSIKRLILVFILCVACGSPDLANDYQKEWCIDTFWRLYGEIPVNWKDGDTELTFSFHDSISIYVNETNNEIIPASFRMKLLENNENYLEVCKIWYEVENID